MFPKAAAMVPISSRLVTATSWSNSPSAIPLAALSILPMPPVMPRVIQKATATATSTDTIVITIMMVVALFAASLISVLMISACALRSSRNLVRCSSTSSVSARRSCPAATASSW